MEKREAVHPHTRGDDSVTLASSTAASGSPPHAWGRRGDGFLIEAGVRFTPTRVGTTGLRHIPPQHGAVHPHTRGDDDRCQIPSFSGSGSPPHAWGRRTKYHDNVPHGRFTPTRVGTTPCLKFWHKPDTVHPHTRGDDSFPQIVPVVGDGSPPHAWGRRSVTGCYRASCRFTPTRVGTTGRVWDRG